MSIEAVSWALNDAPDVKAQHVSVLVVLAETADNDGTGCFPSVKTIAYKTRKSERQVNRDLAAMKEDGLIRDGDPRRAFYLPVDRRPHVWDLAMEKVREDPAPWNRHPSGKSSIKTTREPVPSENYRGDTDVIPVEEVIHNRGGTDVIPAPGYPQPGCHPGQTGVTPMTDRGDMGVTQTVLEPPQETIPPLPPVDTVDENAPSPAPGVEEDSNNTVNLVVEAKQLVRSVVSDHEMELIRHHRRNHELAEAVAGLLAARCSRRSITEVLSRDRSGLGDVVAGLIGRLRSLKPMPDENPNNDVFASQGSNEGPSQPIPTFCGRCSNGHANNPKTYRRIITDDNGTLGDMCACHPEHPTNLIKEMENA